MIHTTPDQCTFLLHPRRSRPPRQVLHDDIQTPALTGTIPTPQKQWPFPLPQALGAHWLSINISQGARSCCASNGTVAASNLRQGTQCDRVREAGCWARDAPAGVVVTFGPASEGVRVWKERIQAAVECFGSVKAASTGH